MAQIQVQHQAPVSGPNGVAPGASGGAQFMLTSLYVGDLDVTVTDEQLYQLFSQVAPVASVRVCRDLASGRSLGYGYVNYNNLRDAARAMDLLNFTPLNNKPIRIMYSQRDPSLRKTGTANIFIKGYGFVQFDNEESAQNAIDKLNGMLINDKQVYVGHFLRKQERETALNKAKFNNVYVKNLSKSTTDEDLKTIFGEYGETTSAVVMRDADGKSKCFGFVNFENADDAAKAVGALNGKKFDDKEWYVGKAQKKSEREHELKAQFEQTMKEAADKSQGANLYIKNLDDSIGDETLKELFSEFGNITSCKLAEMNGKMVVSKPLYVAVAQRKEERRARLQAQFSQMRPIIPSVAPRMPMFPPGAPGLGQQFLYGQAPPAMLPPQASFGYQQQLLPGMRPGGPPVPNFFVPMVQQGQQGQRPGGRRGAGAVQQTQQPMPMMQQQMMPRGRAYRYPPGRNMPEVPLSNVGGGMLSVPYDMGGMPLRDAGIGQPMPIPALATALANATPEQQRTMLGESLYPLVERLERDAAAKVTGMLLEMDQTEVLHLLESPEALKAKVAEAMEVLRSVAAQQQANNQADQLASLSLNDNLVS
ncbi:Polyadenylate-binding 2 -like protein [Gossypium arboreum]|uniref:Polyadenylate-binding 2-like protein n=1 Tax=Gossypium arboreum TaxID=29729 RepID=A0A0B0MRN3_GOSAR|nr:Polyadenylate-binding 2 -like protein [Gossypium arboreum]